MDVPEDLRYTPSHEWVRLEGDLVRVGITDYAQKELGDVVFVELPTPGRALGKDDVFGSIESVKAVSDLYAPVAGEVVETNEALEQSPETVNGAPYGEGWLIALRPEDASQVERLMSAADYREHVGEG